MDGIVSHYHIWPEYCRGLYLPKIGYFCPQPPFLNYIISPRYSENFPFFHLFPLIFASVFNKSSDFFPSQPIIHIFAPLPRGGGAKWKIYTPRVLYSTICFICLSCILGAWIIPKGLLFALGDTLNKKGMGAHSRKYTINSNVSYTS